MRFADLATDEQLLAELGRRLERLRLSRNVTQAGLAEAAGVGLRTLKRLEAGEGATAANLLRTLRALELLDGLEHLLPPASAPAEDAPRERRRASRARPDGTASSP